MGGLGFKKGPGTIRFFIKMCNAYVKTIRTHLCHQYDPQFIYFASNGNTYARIVRPLASHIIIIFINGIIKIII